MKKLINKIQESEKLFWKYYDKFEKKDLMYLLLCNIDYDDNDKYLKGMLKTIKERRKLKQ